MIETRKIATDTIPAIKRFIFAPFQVQAMMVQNAPIMGRNIPQCKNSPKSQVFGSKSPAVSGRRATI